MMPKHYDSSIFVMVINGTIHRLYLNKDVTLKEFLKSEIYSHYPESRKPRVLDMYYMDDENDRIDVPENIDFEVYKTTVPRPVLHITHSHTMFEIGEETFVQKNDGLYTTRFVPKYTVVSVYSGKLLSEEDFQNFQTIVFKKTNGKLSGTEYALRHQPLTLAMSGGKMDKTKHVAAVTIVPVGSDGVLLEEYKKCKAFYANEPPINKTINSCIVANYDNETMELMTIQDLPKDSPIYRKTHTVRYYDNTSYHGILYYKYGGNIILREGKNRPRVLVQYVKVDGTP